MVAPRSAFAANELPVAVCICAHNPRPDILATVINSLAQQTSPSDTFRVILIDNASKPPISRNVVAPLLARGVDASVVVEPRLGLIYGRLRASEDAIAQWTLFVDDDNELDPDYIEVGLKFARSHPNVGAFGGSQVLPDDIPRPAWTAPFLPYLAVRECGPLAIIEQRDEWGPWEPAGAGAWVHRDVLDDFRRRLTNDRRGLLLGRKGGTGLNSCEDGLVMRCAFRVGRPTAYVPELSLRHHIAPSRFEFPYLVRLLRALGQSQVWLERILRGPVTAPEYYADDAQFQKVLDYEVGNTMNARFAIARMAFHQGARHAHLDVEATLYPQR